MELIPIEARGPIPSLPPTRRGWPLAIDTSMVLVFPSWAATGDADFRQMHTKINLETNKTMYVLRSIYPKTMIVSRRMSGFNFKIIVARNRNVSLDAEFEAVGNRFLGTRITDSLLPRRIQWLEPDHRSRYSR